MKIEKGDQVLIMKDVQVYQNVWWKRMLGIKRYERKRKVVTVSDITVHEESYGALISFEYDGSEWIPCMWSWTLRKLMREANPTLFENAAESITI